MLQKNNFLSAIQLYMCRLIRLIVESTCEAAELVEAKNVIVVAAKIDRDVVDHFPPEDGYCVFVPDVSVHPYPTNIWILVLIRAGWSHKVGSVTPIRLEA
jgi:hypothetical protein